MGKIIFLAYILLQGVQSAHWTTTSPPDGHIIYDCLDDRVTLPWQYELDSGDRVGEVTWYYTGSSQEVMAVVTHGIFVPMATFGNRLSLVGNAGLSVGKLQSGDSGNFSVEVQVFSQAGTVSTLRRSVAIIISDRLMTSDGVLHAVQDTAAVLDPSSGLWSIQLSCGAFLYQDHPPFSVEWLMGDSVLNSTGYSDHHFRLILSNPVQGGSYVCRIPPQYAADVCLHDNTTEASVIVDKNDAKHALLVKEFQLQKEQIQLLKDEDQVLKDQIHVLNGQHQQQVDRIQLLEQKLRDEQLKVNNISATVSKIESEARQPVAFHANSLAGNRPSANTPLIFSNVIYNVGGGYDSRSGYFTAPVAGIYFFAASTGGDQGFYAYLMANNVGLGTIYGANGRQQATAQGVVHLQRGQKVWLKADVSTYDVGYGSVFSGFLLSRDV